MDENYFFSIVENLYKSTCMRHYHSTFEVYYLKEGECSYFIDHRAYEVRPGDIVLIPGGIIHKTNYPDIPHTRMLINCTSAFIPERVIPRLGEIGYVYRNPDTVARVESVFERIAAEYERRDEFREEALKGLTGELFFILARNENKCTPEEGKITFIEETVKYINENYMRDITLADMAKMRSVSPAHLSRTFKSETGLGFSEYLTLRRLRAAEIMLKHSAGKSICEISAACGFNDSNYFSDRFKKFYGVSPSKIKDKR